MSHFLPLPIKNAFHRVQRHPKHEYKAHFLQTGSRCRDSCIIGKGRRRYDMWPEMQMAEYPRNRNTNLSWRDKELLIKQCRSSSNHGDNSKTKHIHNHFPERALATTKRTTTWSLISTHSQHCWMLCPTLLLWYVPVDTRYLYRKRSGWSAHTHTHTHTPHTNHGPAYV